MPAFCRHNRFEANCAICSREREAAAPAPVTRARSSAGRTAPSPPKRGPRPRAGAMRTRRVVRDVDDGFRVELAPGLKASSDAERLARAIALAAARLEAPGPYPPVATEPDLEQAIWLAFLLALAGPQAPELRTAVLAAQPAWTDGNPEGLDGARTRAVAAYRAWAARSGTQAAGLEGEPAWTPERRFSRVFDRLALPGVGRSVRYDLLVTVGVAGRIGLAPASLHLGGDDPTTEGAKRALLSGDVVLLERRAAALAAAAQVPVAALDVGLATWSGVGEVPDAVDAPALPRIRAALGL